MQKTQQAVNQQDGTVNIKSAQLGKQIAAFLVPDYMEGQKLAIVDESVLDYLTKLLPTASYDEIKHAFIQDCRDMDNLDALVLHAKRFVAFHETCNLLKYYFDKNAKVVMEEPFNKAPEPPKLLTLQEMELKLELMHKEAEELMGDITNHPDSKHRDFKAKNVVEEPIVAKAH